MPLNILGLYRDSDIQGVKKWIAEKKDLNLQDGWGQTTLMLSIRDGDLDVAERLIKAGADLDLKNKAGRNAKRYADSVGESYYDDDKHITKWFNRIVKQTKNKKIYDPF